MWELTSVFLIMSKELNSYSYNFIVSFKKKRLTMLSCQHKPGTITEPYVFVCSITRLIFFFPASHVLFLSVTIDSLYKVTEGGQSDIFHRHADGSLDPACCFTVYHGNHMESLDLVTSNAEEARTWITGLRYLMAGISDEDSLAKRQRTHDQYPSVKRDVFYVHVIRFEFCLFGITQST